jgi:hypothetical protein
VDNRVALLSTIIHRITFCYDHRGKGGATSESTLSNTCNAARNSNRFQR